MRVFPRSVPKLMIAAAVVCGLGAGVFTWLLSLVGPTAGLVAPGVVIGGVGGVVTYFGYDTRRRLARIAKHQDAAWRRQVEQPRRNELAAIVMDTRNHLRGEIVQLRASAQQDARQLEALMNLHALIPVRGVLPESRGWAASPDLLLTYVGQILNGAPDLVVECGSGLSTLWAALALETLGGTGRVVALEHDPRFLAGTRASLEAHGVAHRAEVRHAPIDEVVVGERRQPWYAPSALNGLDGIGVLFVDGPIGSLDPQARYPAIPLMRGRLRPGAAILLDDADRPEEKDVVAHWLSDWPELDSQVLRLEKGAVLLRVPS